MNFLLCKIRLVLSRVRAECGNLQNKIFAFSFSLNTGMRTRKAHCTKKDFFLLRISSANVIKAAGNCGFGHIY